MLFKKTAAAESSHLESAVTKQPEQGGRESTNTLNWAISKETTEAHSRWKCREFITLQKGKKRITRHEKKNTIKN
jgi:hypothetical protein